MKLNFLVLCLLLISTTAFGRLSNADKAKIQISTLITNSGFENGLAKWSNTGGTFAVETSDVENGKGAASFDTTATGQYIINESISVPKGLNKSPCSTYIHYKGDASLYKLQVLNASDAVQKEVVLKNHTVWGKSNGISVLCENTAKVKIISTADGASIKIDSIIVQDGSLTTLALDITPAPVKYAVNATQTLSSGAWNNMNYGSKIYDDDNLVTSTIPFTYTAPVAGTIRVTVGTMLNADGGWSGTSAESLIISATNIPAGNVPLGRIYPITGSVATINGSGTFKVNKGTVLFISALQTAGGNVALPSSAANNWVAIEYAEPIKTDAIVIPAEAGSQILRYDGFISKYNDNVRLKTRQYNLDSEGNDTSELMSDNNTYFTRITAEKDCYFDVTFTQNSSTTASYADIIRYNSADTVLEQNHSYAVNNYEYAISSAVYRMNKGDYLSFKNTQTPIDGTVQSVVQVIATPLKAQFKAAIPSKVSARYTTNAGQLINSAGSDEIVNYEDKVYDTHNAVTIGASWVFTSPVDAYYSVNAVVNSSDAQTGANEIGNISIMKNGTRFSNTQIYGNPTDYIYRMPSITISDLVYLKKGEYISIGAWGSWSGSSFNLVADGVRNWVSINQI